MFSHDVNFSLIVLTSELSVFRDFHGKQLWCSGRPAAASAAIARHGRLFLRETQQLLPDGLDEGGGGVGGRGDVPLLRRCQVPPPGAGSVQRGGGGAAAVHLGERRRQTVVMNHFEGFSFTHCVFLRLLPGEAVVMVTVPAHAAVLAAGGRPDPRRVAVGVTRQPHLRQMMGLGSCTVGSAEDRRYTTADTSRLNYIVCKFYI